MGVGLKRLSELLINGADRNLRNPESLTDPPLSKTLELVARRDEIDRTRRSTTITDTVKKRHFIITHAAKESYNAVNFCLFEMQAFASIAYELFFVKMQYLQRHA